MMKKPYSHQVEGARFLHKQRSGCLYIEMRGGKTLTCLLAIMRSGAFPVLIMGPYGPLYSWCAEILDAGYSPEDIQMLDGTSTVRRQKNLLVLQRPLFYLVNFEKCRAADVLNIRRKCKLPGVDDFKTIVVDESYLISNPEAKITRYMLSAKHPVGQHRYCLSGSPNPETPLNFVTQFLFCIRHFMGYGDYVSYLQAHWQYNRWSMRWEMIHRSHKQKIYKFVHQHAYCRTMQELGIGVKPCHEYHTTQPTDTQDRLLRINELSNTYINTDGVEKLLIPIVRVLRERRIAAGIHPDTGEVISTQKQQHIIDYHKSTGERLLVLSFFVPPVVVGWKLALDNNVRSACITGRTQKHDRESIREGFQNNEIDIVWAQVSPVKMGLDFSALDAIFYISNSYAYDDRNQSEKRGNHAQRTVPYRIVDAIYPNTVERDLVQCLVRKKRNAAYYVEKWAQGIINRPL